MVTEPLPETSLGPLQAPEAVQDVAPDEPHDSMTVLPTVPLSALDEKFEIVGSPGDTPVTLVVLVVVPPALPQDSEKLFTPAALIVTLWLPLVERDPLQAPEAVQELAPTLLQVRVTLDPTVVVAAPAVSETVGAETPGPAPALTTMAASLAVPAEFRQEMEKVVRLAPTVTVRSLLAPFVKLSAPSGKPETAGVADEVHEAASSMNMVNFTDVLLAVFTSEANISVRLSVREGLLYPLIRDGFVPIESRYGRRPAPSVPSPVQAVESFG